MYISHNTQSLTATCYTCDNSIENIDYDSGPFDIVIPSEVVNLTFNISIFTDNILEGDEAFYLRIDSSSLPDNVTVGKWNTTTVVILDDDCKYFNIIFISSIYKYHSYYHHIQSVNIYY